jgi:hypothetical protein
VTIDSIDLPHWDQFKDNYFRKGILIGNGQSRAVSSGYEYSSLFESACDLNEVRRLGENEKNLFGEFETQNFERILGSLLVTRKTLQAFDVDHPNLELIEETYDKIRLAMIESIRMNHCEPSELASEAKLLMGEEYLNYDWVFSTNYDLLCYWALMHSSEELGKRDRLEDFFRRVGPNQLSFKERAAPHFAQATDVTKVAYLHGALHLLRHEDGDVTKIQYHRNESILRQLDDATRAGKVPLFVSEGASSDKWRTIRESSYLSFAMDQFSKYKDNLVVFGHKLGETDQHLVNVINAVPDRSVAVSIYPQQGVDLEAKKRIILGRLNRVTRVEFFDSSTHPLGDDQLRADP